MAARLLTIPQIEKERGIKSTVLHHWIRSGLPSQKIGRDIVIDLDELDRFIKERIEITTTYRVKKSDGSEEE